MNGLLVASVYLPNGNPQPGPKFDDNAFRRNAGFRMDFLLLTPDLLPRLSDHAPVWIALD